jgi:glycosyltransferase involved in cell wall biosynthesis
VTGSELHFIVPGSLDQRTGGSIYDTRIVEGLRRRGWAVVVHGLAGKFPLGDARARASLAETLGRLPDGLRVVIDGLAMGGMPDVIREHGARLRVLALVHLLLADEPGLDPDQRDRYLELEREALACSGMIVVTSTFTAARLKDIGVDPAVIRTVPPGTDPAPLAPGPGSDALPRLLCVASVTPGKAQDVLVRALIRLAEIPWDCICAGSVTRSPAFAHEVQRITREAGLSDRISFPGECDGDTLDKLYLTSSVFVFPSLYEGYGMALTEAMARGLPVITTTGGAIPQTVPADAGILVPPGDDAALADALRPLLVDAPNEPRSARVRRARLGAAARRHASRLPGWDQAVDAFSEVASALEAKNDG